MNNKKNIKRNSKKYIAKSTTKEKIISGIMAFTIFITPFINTWKNNKPKNTNNSTSQTITINKSPLTSAIEVILDKIPTPTISTQQQDSTTPTKESNNNTEEESTTPTKESNNIIEKDSTTLNQEPNNNIIENEIEEELNPTIYINYINSIETNYNHENYYPTINDINKIIEASKNTTTCNYQYNNNLQNLINQIKDNSNYFLESNPSFISAFISKDATNQNIISDQINFEKEFTNALKNLINYSTNNLNEDICTIKDLKVVFSYTDELEYSYTSAYYSWKYNLMVILPNNVYKNAQLIQVDYQEYLENVLIHELNHARQCLCNCNKNNNQPTRDINIKTLIEASAESEPYNLKRTNLLEKNLSYSSERTCETLILTLGLFHNNQTLEDYYNAIFNSDLKALYNFCGAKSTNEIYELYKIFYAIDAINKNNNLGQNYSYNNNLKEIIGYDYKVDIFKNVLKNMINYTYNNDDFELKDNLIMLNIIKSLIVSNSNENQYSNDQEFILNIYDLENKYIEFLSKYYNVPITAIRQIENNDIYWELSAIFDICNDYDSPYTSIEYYDYANQIVEKFPLLEPILAANIISNYEYNNFITNNQNILIKRH